jgi:hypothetical protein
MACFVLVTTDRGAGWVPERHLDRDGSVAVVNEAYDTTELEALFEDRLSGWMRCRANDGREGWVPEKTLSRLS